MENLPEVMWLVEHPRPPRPEDVHERQVHVLPNGWVRVCWTDGEQTLHSPAAVHSVRGVESGPERSVWVVGE